MLRRFLRQASPSPELVDQMTFQDLIRTGSAQGLLLSDWAAWRHYRGMRARTSHSYSATVAAEIVQDIPAFLADAIYLRDALLRRLA
jgi:hypothetical protein